MTDFDDDLPAEFYDPDRDETITGQVKGRWVVRARIRQGDIQVVVTGGPDARSGVNTYDKSVTLAGDNWIPLIIEAMLEMRHRTGLSVRTDCFQVCCIDDTEREEVAEMLAFVLSEVGNAPFRMLTAH